MSLGVVPRGATTSSSAARDLSVYTFLKLVAIEVRDRVRNHDS